MGSILTLVGSALAATAQQPKPAQRQTLNLITPERKREAAKLVREGVSVSLARDLNAEKAGRFLARGFSDSLTLRIYRPRHSSGGSPQHTLWPTDQGSLGAIGSNELFVRLQLKKQTTAIISTKVVAGAGLS
jgi:hypothetical protein